MNNNQNDNLGQKLFRKILFILKKILGIFFLLESVGGIAAIIQSCIDASEIYEILIYAIFTILFSLFSYLCLRKNKAKNVINTSVYTDIPYSQNMFNENPKNTAYIDTKTTIYRADGKEISDKEIPYLIQLGYEHTLQTEANSSNPKFHRTAREDDLSYNFESKYYNEISKRTTKFEDLYHDSYTEKNLSKKILLLEEALKEYDCCKKFCYSKGKVGTIYFQDMYEYLSNSHNECFSYRDMILNTLKESYFERDELIPEIKKVISCHDGILQKNIYKELPEFQRMLRKLESENIITRIKKSGTYELHLNVTD